MTRIATYIVAGLILTVGWLTAAGAQNAPAPDKIQAVEITGIPPGDRAELLQKLRPGSGATLDSAAVSRMLARLARYYADRGYPYCNARLANISWPDEHRAALSFAVERGQLVRLGNVDITGGGTRPDVLHRLAGITPGELYNEHALELAPRRLMASGLFRAVDSMRISRGRTVSTVDIGLAADELPGSHLEAAIGSGGGSGGGNGDRGVAGLVSLRLANLFGSARRASVRWQRPGRDWQSIELSYREPWLAGSPVSLEFAFSQQLRDSLFTQTVAEVGLETEIGAGMTAGLGAAYGSASPGSDTWAGAESSRLWALTGRVGWSSLLVPLNPVSGLRLAANGSVGRREVDGLDLREVRARVGGEFYRPLGSNYHIAALSGGAALVSRGNGTPAEIPWHARIPVGGTLPGGVQVRGHAEETTRAVRAGWLSAEYRFLTSEAGRVFAFYDLAVVEQATGSGDGWRTVTLHGLGGGIQADTRLGIIEIAVAVDPERGPGEGRLHLKLAQSF